MSESEQQKKQKQRRVGCRKQLAHDKYLIRVFLLKDSEGKRRYHTETFHGPARKADDRIREIIRRHRAGEPIKLSADTFSAFLDEWLETKRQGVSESSLKIYRKLVELYVRPRLGKLLLAQVRADDVQRAYGKLMEGEKGVSAATVRHCHDLLNMVFKLAVIRGKLPGSPMPGVTAPRLEDDERARAMSVEQVGRFLDAAKGGRFDNLFRLAFHVGCRPGELLALKWDDLDARAATIRIDQTIIWRKAGDWYLKPPKTRAGRRVITLTAGLVDILKQQRSRQLEMRLQSGSRWQDHGFIFSTENGSPWAQWHLRDDFKRVVKQAGLPWGFNPYSARHTAATLLLATGQHPKLVSDQLGHSRISITLDTYSHSDVGMKSGLTAEIERLLDRNDQLGITQSLNGQGESG